VVKPPLRTKTLGTHVNATGAQSAFGPPRANLLRRRSVYLPLRRTFVSPPTAPGETRTKFMAKMTPFRYVEFYDVPRCIALRHGKRLFLLQSAFDEALDDYETSYSIYVLPESAEGSLKKGLWEFVGKTPMTCIGDVKVRDVVFDSSKRKELDASFLDDLITDEEADGPGF
jgi:hypothetical protein